jgi:uncharacterized protein
MIYCDTSLLVSALTVEQETPVSRKWIATQDAGVLCTSGWTVAEFSSALSIKLRTKAISETERAAVMTYWRLMLVENIVIVPVPAHAFDLAARFADQHQLNLRAADALHLAVASVHGVPIATLDRTMAKAALEVGIEVQAIAG